MHIYHWKSFSACVGVSESGVNQNLHAFKSDCWQRRRRNENKIKINYFASKLRIKQKQPKKNHRPILMVAPVKLFQISTMKFDLRPKTFPQKNSNKEEDDQIQYA